jgi:hypothetical protein
MDDQTFLDASVNASQQPVAPHPRPYGAPSEPAAHSSGLGMIAGIGGIVLFALSAAVSVVAGGIVGFATDPYASWDETMAAPTTEADVAFGLVFVAQLVLGSIVGVWVLTQGIFAIVLRRGRGWGIAAVALAVAAPLFSIVVYLVVSGATSMSNL